MLSKLETKKINNPYDEKNMIFINSESN